MPAFETDVRNDLHQLIDAIPDTAVLVAVRTILAAQWQAENTPIALTAAAQEAVAEGLRQLNAGEGIPHEQVMAEARAAYGQA